MMVNLDTIDNEIKICELYAQYWMALATTGVCQDRDMHHGSFGNKPFTPEEKTKDAMDTAARHIHNMMKLIDKKKEELYRESIERYNISCGCEACKGWEEFHAKKIHRKD